MLNNDTRNDVIAITKDFLKERMYHDEELFNACQGTTGLYFNENSNEEECGINKKSSNEKV